MRAPSRKLQPVALAVAIVVAGLAVACGPGGHFQVKREPTFTKGGDVSILGVLRDGSFDPDPWQRIKPAFWPDKTCDLGYSAKFVAEHDAFAKAIDDYVAANGATDDLLHALAPLAKSDRILLVSVAGLPSEAARPVHGARRSTGQLGPPATPRPKKKTGHPGQRTLLTASVFSVREGKTVAELTMTYGGADDDGAEPLAAFAQRFTEEFSLSGCAGWSADGAGVNEGAIRALPPP